MQHFAIGGIAFALFVFFVLPEVGFTDDGEPTWIIWCINSVLLWIFVGTWKVLPRFHKKWPHLSTVARYKIAFFWPLYRSWLNTMEQQEKEKKEDDSS